jgi:hypothetical protein
MFKNPLRIAALFGILLMPFGEAMAELDPICEHPPFVACESTEYSRTNNEDCEKSGLHSCPFHTVPPGVSQFNCRLRNGTYTCTTYPKGPGFSYSYYGTPGLWISDEGPTESPTVSVYCNNPGVPGSVTVTVTSPFGISSSESMEIPCGQPWD